MGIPTVSLSRRMSAVVPYLAGHPDEVDSQISEIFQIFAAFRDSL